MDAAGVMVMAATGYPAKTTEKRRKETLKKLEHWRELLLQVKAGVTACKLHPDAIRLELNELLDELIDQAGTRGRDPSVWDREWVPSWRRDRMFKGVEDR